VPYLVSVLLLLVSLWIRLQLSESPVFQRMKAEGKGCENPLGESFGEWRNLKVVLIALFGAAAGQGVVWCAGQFYALFLLEKMAKVDSPTANIMVAAALILATPFFVFFGRPSGRGRPRADHPQRLPDPRRPPTSRCSRR
jgi:hypothetical protein